MFNEIALLIGQFLGATLILWVLFANVMVLDAKRKKAKGVPKVLLTIVLAPLALGGYVYDVIYNVFVGTLFFLQLPRINFSSRANFINKSEWTLTARLVRYIQKDKGWRHTTAIFICRYLVEPLAADHCSLPGHIRMKH